jgi:hypothetical protein
MTTDANVNGAFASVDVDDPDTGQGKAPDIVRVE